MAGAKTSRCKNIHLSSALRCAFEIGDSVRKKNATSAGSYREVDLPMQFF